jgi:transcriptional regulator with AAA-type ATPase domain
MGSNGQGPGEEDEIVGSAGRAVALHLVISLRDAAWIHPLPPRGEVTIGRSRENDVCLSDPAVSRKHAVLHIGAEVRIQRLSRINKVYVGSPRKGTEPGTRGRDLREVVDTLEIALGDAIRIGSSTIELRRTCVSGPLDPVGVTVEVDQLVALAGKDTVIEPPTLATLLEQAYRVAKSNLHVVIVGEAGVGKRVLGRLMHTRSARAGRPFRVLSCSSALPEKLLESELFGYERGAFPEAITARPGILELADGGTVFLDNVDALPARLQGRLQVALEQGRIFRVGGGTARLADVRIIAATQRDLGLEVSRGAFREDLHRLLSVVELAIRPLRARVADIGPLADVCLSDACRKCQRTTVPTLSPEARSALDRYPWPGNVMELRRLMARVAVQCADDTVTPDHLGLQPDDSYGDDTDHGRKTPAPWPSEVRAVVRLLPDSRFQQVYKAAVEGALKRDVLLERIDPVFVAGLPSQSSHAQQLYGDLTELDKAAWLDDGTVPLAVWLNNAVMLVRSPAARKVFEGALAELGAVLSGARLPEEQLAVLRDAAVTARLDRNLLLAAIDPDFVGSFAIHPDPAHQILGDLHALNGASLVVEKVPLQAWLQSATTLLGVRLGSLVFRGASERLLASLGASKAP